MNYTVDKFIDWAYENTLKDNDFGQMNAENYHDFVSSKRDMIRKNLTLEKISSIGNNALPEWTNIIDRGDYTIHCGNWEVLPHLNTHFYMLSPKNAKKTDDGKIKTMIYCRGHGDETVQKKLIQEDSAENLYSPKVMVKAGYTVFVPEFIGYSDSLYEGYKGSEYEKRCPSIYTNLAMMGMSLLGVRVYHVMRTISFIQSTYKTDSIGCMGFSGGGTVAQMITAIDDRIKAGVICSYANTYKESILAMHHCICNFTHGMLEIGEEAEIMALSAPTPILIVSGKEDPIFPVEGVKRTYAKLKEYYGILGEENRIAIDIFDDGHQANPTPFCDFLDKWL